MSRIVFFETESWEEPVLKEHLAGQDVFFCPHTLEEGQEYDSHFFEAEIISVFAYSQVSKEILQKFPNLKCIATRSTGYDHIDLAFCREKGITVSNVPAYGVHTVAEHVFSLILALSRKLIPSIERTRKGDFRVEGLMGFELFGKTLGVIGTGNIGSVVCSIGLGFGMQVIAYNRSENEDLKNKGVRFVGLDELLGNADIITVHVPLVSETKHLINVSNIEKVKKGSILINAARGPIVETQAILNGLTKGILSAVGLDVLEEECGMREERELLSTKFLETCDLKTQLLDHILLDREDVIVTPHNGFNSKEALDQILKITIQNIQGYLENKPQNTVS